MTTLPLIALVGRPNVGKSSLFNVLTHSRRALVDDTPGLTRDRQYGQVVWPGFPFRVVDTGGFEADPQEAVAASIRTQAMVAVEEADLIILVVDGIAGPLPDDSFLADTLRRSGKPVILAINKTESSRNAMAAVEFHRLGLTNMETIAAIHRQGIEDLLTLVAQQIPQAPPTPPIADTESPTRRVAIIGCPNAGKSSLLNRLLGEERQLTSPVAGTTRDSIDLPWTDQQGNHYLLIDTAGIRRKSRTSLRIEKFAIISALKAIDRAELAILVLDAYRGITDQDQQVAEYAIRAGCGLVLAVNKWDLIPATEESAKSFRLHLANAFPRFAHAPTVFLSALTGRGIPKLFPAVHRVWNAANQRIGTGALNRALMEMVAARPHPRVTGGQPVKIRYATQVSVQPPTLVFFTNHPDAIQENYKRYLENRLRESFDFAGIPLRLIFRGGENPYHTPETATTRAKPRHRR